MLFTITTIDNNTVVSRDLDEYAPAVRLQEGKPHKGHKYPLLSAKDGGARRSLDCTIERTE